MASPFRDDVVAMQAEVFADLGFDATFTPDGGAAVPGIKVIPDAQNVESLGADYGMRALQVQRLVAIRKADVPAKPVKGDVIAIPGFEQETFTVMEEARCLDKFQLVWLCAVTE